MCFLPPSLGFLLISCAGVHDYTLHLTSVRIPEITDSDRRRACNLLRMLWQSGSITTSSVACCCAICCGSRHGCHDPHVRYHQPQSRGATFERWIPILRYRERYPVRYHVQPILLLSHHASFGISRGRVSSILVASIMLCCLILEISVIYKLWKNWSDLRKRRRNHPMLSLALRVLTFSVFGCLGIG